MTHVVDLEGGRVDMHRVGDTSCNPIFARHFYN
jgi:hypothetical protein